MSSQSLHNRWVSELVVPGPTHVGENEVLQVNLLHRPRGVVDRAISSHEEGALLVRVTGLDDLLVAGKGAGITSGSAESAMGREELLDFSGQLHREATSTIR